MVSSLPIFTSIPTLTATRGPQKRHPRALRDPIRRPRLSRPRDTARTSPQSVRIHPTTFPRGSLSSMHTHTQEPTNKPQQKPHPHPLHPLNPHPRYSPNTTRRNPRPLQSPPLQHPSSSRNHRLRGLRPQPGHLHPRVRGTGPTRQPGSKRETGGLRRLPGRAGPRNAQRNARMSRRG